MESTLLRQADSTQDMLKPDTTLSMTQRKACFRIYDLPYELECEIVRWVSKDEWGKSSLLNMACVNSYYKNIAGRLFDCFEFDSVQDFGGNLFQDFVKNIMVDDGARAMHMKRLHLNTGWCERSYHTLQNGYSPDADPADLFGFWAMHKMKCLKELSVAYKPDLTFLSTDLPPNLQSLIIRPEGRPGFKFGSKVHLPVVEMKGTVDVSFLPSVLLAPSLRHFDLGGQIIVHEDIVCTDEVPVNQSSIQHLSLSVGNFSDRAMLKLLQIPYGLRALDFTPRSFWDRDPEGRPDHQIVSDPANLPATSTFGDGLASQTATLEKLTLRRAESYWHPSFDEIGPLSDFHALKHLDIDCTMLLGWSHCQHLQAHDDPSSWIPPSSLPALLPPNIETLELRFEDYHNRRRDGSTNRNGKDFILDVLYGLKTASRTLLLALRSVAFNTDSSLPYCPHCRVDSPILDLKEAREVCEAAGDAPFDFKIVNHEIEWAGCCDDENRIKERWCGIETE